MKTSIEFKPSEINDTYFGIHTAFIKSGKDKIRYLITGYHKTNRFLDKKVSISIKLNSTNENGNVKEITRTLIIAKGLKSATIGGEIEAISLELKNKSTYGIQFIKNDHNPKNVSNPLENKIDDDLFHLMLIPEPGAALGVINYGLYHKNIEFFECPIELIKPLTIRTVSSTRKEDSRVGMDTWTKTGSGTLKYNDMVLYDSDPRDYEIKFPAWYIEDVEFGVEINKLDPTAEFSQFEVTLYRKRPVSGNRKVSVTLYTRFFSENDWIDKKIIINLTEKETHASIITKEKGRVLAIPDPNKIGVERERKDIPTVFDSLVFSGGGAKGLAYAGAIKQLETEKIIGKDKKGEPKIKKVAGASAGAIVALAYALAYTPDEIYNIVKKTSFKNFLTTEKGNLLDILKDPSNHKMDIVNLLLHFSDNYALCKDTMVREFFTKLIKDKTGDENITFKALADLTHIELNVVVGDLTRRQTKIYNSTNNPSDKVIDTVMASMSIPLIFPPVDLKPSEYGKKSTFVDGGLTNNYPLNEISDYPLGMILSKEYREFL